MPRGRIRPDKLVEDARNLVQHHEAQGRPRHSLLRRGISTAYYGLFHHLSYSTACHLLPNATAEEQLALCRSIDHSGIKRVCEWIANPGSTPEHARALVNSLGSPRVVNVALAFADLYDARHKADYDHLSVFSKTVALQYVNAAEQAISDLDRAAARSREVLFALIALQARKVE